MGDEQWPSNRGGAQRQRPGQTSGGRPSGGFNTAGGQSSFSSPGNSRPVQRPGMSGPTSRPQGQWRDEGGWNNGSPDRSIPPQRRGPGGPTSGGLNGGRSGGAGAQDQRGRGGWDSDERGTGAGNTRNSRTLTPPPGRSGQTQSGRMGQTGQWSNTNSRGWQEDSRQRPSSGQLGQGRASAPQRAQGRNTMVRGNWVVDVNAKGGGGGSNNNLRKRLLLLMLAVVVTLGGAVALVPSIRHRVECYLPGFCASTANQPPAAAPGTLILQVNVPSASVTVDKQAPQTTQAGQTAPFSSVTLKNLTAGKHTLTIHADGYADVTNQSITLSASGATMTAWLAPGSDNLTKLGTQLGTPATQPDDGVAGDHYATDKTANGAISISVQYTIGGLSATTFPSQLAQGSDTKTSPFKPVTLTLVPTFTFKNSAGTTLLTTGPQALPATQFGLQVLPFVDDKGAPQLSTQGIVLTAGGQSIKTTFAGPSKNDYALYFALASILPASPPSGLNLTCIGAVDNQKFNPEDGLFIVDSTDDTTHAHYFYRWGILWATNSVAHTLTPNAPMAVAGSAEFSDANQARTNASCGS